jgi:hypothetical protein
MRLGDNKEYVIISASQEAYENGATGPDIFAVVDVRVGDFSAEIGTVVARSDWAVFLTALSELEKKRRGEALLQSADGEELRLRIYACDGAGHMAVAGEIDRRDLLSHPRFTFGRVQFDPTLLPQLVAELGAVTPDGGDEDV